MLFYSELSKCQNRKLIYGRILLEIFSAGSWVVPRFHRPLQIKSVGDFFVRRPMQRKYAAKAAHGSRGE